MAEIVRFPRRPWRRMALWSLDMLELALAERQARLAQDRLRLLRLQQGMRELEEWH